MMSYMFLHVTKWIGNLGKTIYHKIFIRKLVKFLFS